MTLLWHSNDVFRYMSKAEFVTLVSLKVPSGGEVDAKQAEELGRFRIFGAQLIEEGKLPFFLFFLFLFVPGHLSTLDTTATTTQYAE